MTPAAILAEITADPAGLGYAALVSVGDDAAVAALLNRADLPGYVPARDVVTTLARRGRWGMVPYAVIHRRLPDGSECPFALYALLATVQLAAYSPVQPPIRFEVGPLAAGLDQVVGLGLFSADDRAAVLAAEVKASRAEILWGYGAAVSATAVGVARNGGG